MKYNVIVADPPWAYRNKRTGGTHNSGSAQKYQTLSAEEIAALPVREHFERNAVCFLWATVPLLPEALAVLKAWGFRYKTVIVWRKVGRNGLGYWFRGQVEILLFGVRGDVKAFRLQRPNVIESKVEGHSTKPEAFTRLVEEATASWPDRRCLELFARRTRPGWTTWGLDLGQDLRTEGHGGEAQSAAGD